MTKLTKEQGVILSGFTGVLCCKFSDFQEDIARRLGRPVFTHELGSAAMEETVKELYRADFLALVAEP